MGPNSINTFSSAAAMAATTAVTQAVDTQPAAAAGQVKILYGDTVKADRLQAGLSALQAIQANTGRYISNINPELGKL